MNHTKHIRGDQGFKRMKSTLRRILLLGFAMIICCAGIGCTEDDELAFEYAEFKFQGYSYYAISKYMGSVNIKEIVIPSEYNGCEVRYILDNSFSGANVEKLDLNLVREVYPEAFTFCTRLNDLDLGVVEVVGRYAFGSCNALESVIIPETVTTIDDGAFEDCINLKEVYFMGDPANLGIGIFDAGVIIYGIPGGNVEAYAVQNGYEFRTADGS